MTVAATTANNASGVGVTVGVGVCVDNGVSVAAGIGVEVCNGVRVAVGV